MLLVTLGKNSAVWIQRWKTASASVAFHSSPLSTLNLLVTSNELYWHLKINNWILTYLLLAMADKPHWMLELSYIPRSKSHWFTRHAMNRCLRHADYQLEFGNNKLIIKHVCVYSFAYLSKVRILHKYMYSMLFYETYIDLELKLGSHTIFITLFVHPKIILK